MRIGIVNIGDELLSGKILNSNQFDLSRMLSPLGHEVAFGLVIGDDIRTLVDVLEWATRGSGEDPLTSNLDIVVLTGGLGPTRDDLTREAVASFLGRKLVEDQQALGWLGAFLGKAADELPTGQRSQAAIPEETEPLRNPVGTACGFRFSDRDLRIYAFPGVPAELKSMAELYLAPELQQEGILLEKVLWTFGWSESSQAQAFSGLALGEPFKFSSLPEPRGVRLSLSCLATATEKKSREAKLDALWIDLIRAIPPEAIVDADGATLPEAVLKLLLARKATVSVAESCTGGGLGVLLTEQPGSSVVFQKGFLTYSNQAKIDLLGVAPETLQSHGAVSEETALAMVQGCLTRSGADYACAITGIAGPDGGSPEKPVGTVWISVASRQGAWARRFQFRGDRTAVRSRSCYTGLNQLRLLISEKLS